jgi:hypothetical protein
MTKKTELIRKVITPEGGNGEEAAPEWSNVEVLQI